MLETVWYLLILALQVLQVDPTLKPDKFQVDVFVGSAPAYSFSVRGDAVQGQVMDTEGKAVFGEFESTRRLPQAYVVFPRAALKAEVEQAMSAAKDSGKDSAGGSTTGSGSAKGTAAGGTAAAEEKPKELYPFTIDFTKTLAQLASFKTQPRQVIVYTEAARFLDSGSKDEKAAAGAKATASPAPSASPKVSASPAPSAAAGAKTSASPSASPAASPEAKAEEEAKIEIRRYANRLVLTAGFVQTVIIVNFMP